MRKPRRNNLFNTVSNIERVRDHADNLAELAIEKVDKDLHLSDEICSPENGVVFIDALINLERISNYPLNIANCVENEAS